MTIHNVPLISPIIWYSIHSKSYIIPTFAMNHKLLQFPILNHSIRSCVSEFSCFQIITELQILFFRCRNYVLVATLFAFYRYFHNAYSPLSTVMGTAPMFCLISKQFALECTEKMLHFP